MDCTPQVIESMCLDSSEGIISFILGIEAANITFVALEPKAQVKGNTAVYSVRIIVDIPDEEMREVLTLYYATIIGVGRMRPCPDTPSMVKIRTLHNFKLGRENRNLTCERQTWDIDKYTAQSVYFELQHLVESEAFEPSFPGMYIRKP